MLTSLLLTLSLSASVESELDFVSAISKARGEGADWVLLEGKVATDGRGYRIEFVAREWRVLVDVAKTGNTTGAQKVALDAASLTAYEPLLSRLRKPETIPAERALGVASARVKDAEIHGIEAKIDAQARLVWEVDLRSQKLEHEVDVDASNAEILSVTERGLTPNSPTLLNFDGDAVGSVPKDFRVDGTQQDGPLATWEIVAKNAEGDTDHVLRMVRPNHRSGQTFNLCWSPDQKFRDGVLSVKLRAESGEEDQGGGLIWRVIDANNYYITRFNPLESNLRLYTVKAGKRAELASANVPGTSGVWFELRVEHIGKNLRVWLDSKPLIEALDDSFPEAGGVGVWTKADAVTSFDDLRIEPRTP